MTKTHNTTSSYGKIQFEDNYLLPTVKEMFQTLTPACSVSVIGTHHGVDRHIKFMLELGIEFDNQFFSEIDKKQFNQVLPKTLPYGINYNFEDIQNRVFDLIKSHKHISLLDLDFCNFINNTNLGWIYWVGMNLDKLDIMIQVVSLRGNKQSLVWLNTMCEGIGIDLSFDINIKVGLLMESIAESIGLNCSWRPYIGAGSTEESNCGNPMLCAIFSKLPIPDHFSIIHDYKKAYKNSNKCRKKNGSMNKAELKRVVGVGDYRTAIQHAVNYVDILTFRDNSSII